jgi:hypothetical protein
MSRPTMQDIIDLDEMLITRHLNPRAEGESLRSCIDRIINWEVAVNLDPAVSSAAQALVDLGKLQARGVPVTEIAEDAWRVRYCYYDTCELILATRQPTREELEQALQELRNDPA